MRKCFYLPLHRSTQRQGDKRSAAADLIASNAPLRNGSHKARQNGPKHYPGDSRGPPTGAPPKPNEVGLVGRGGAAERLSFCPERQNEGCGACDDEARLSPLSFVVQRKMGSPKGLPPCSVASKLKISKKPVETCELLFFSTPPFYGSIKP